MKYETSSVAALESKDRGLSLAFKQWRESGEAKPRHLHRAGAVARILCALSSGIPVTPEALHAAGKALGKAASYTELALAATRAFLRWAAGKQLLRVELRLDPAAEQDPPGLKEALAEADEIMAAHRIKRKGTGVSKNYIKACVSDLAEFLRWDWGSDPRPDLGWVGRLNVDRLVKWQTKLQTTPKDAAGEPLSPKTIFNKLDGLVSIKRAGIKQKRAGFSEADLEGLELDGFDDSEQAERYFPREPIAKMYSLDLTECAKLSLEERFVAIRNATMVILTYSAALRCDETRRLTMDALFWDEVTPGGLLPSVIKAAKCRSKNAKDRIHFPPDAAELLRHFLDVRQELCRQKGHEVPLIKDEKHGGLLGVPVFISVDGNGLSRNAIRDIFKKLAERAGIRLKPGQALHCLRHSRITHWVEDGLPLELVKALARHSDIKMTEKYYHRTERTEVRKLEELYGTRSAAMSAGVLPPQHVIAGIVLAAMRALGNAQPLLAEARRIASEIRSSVDPTWMLGEFYTLPETCSRLGKSRSQIYEDIRAGRLRPMTLPNSKKAFSRSEIDRIASLRSAIEAQVALGMRSRSGLHRLFKEGHIVGECFGHDLRFTDTAIVNAAIEKNLSKIRLRRVLKQPAGFSSEFGPLDVKPNVAGDEKRPVLYASGYINDPKKPENTIGLP